MLMAYKDPMLMAYKDPMLMAYKDPMLIEIDCQYWQLLEIGILYNSPLLCQIIAKLFIK
jgi:hypothetical protein